MRGGAGARLAPHRRTEAPFSSGLSMPPAWGREGARAEEGGLPSGGKLAPQEVARGSSQLREEDLALINKLLQV